MKNFITCVLITQLSTCISVALMIVAHLIGTGSILNPNWSFAIYFLLGIAMFFMLLPHLVHWQEQTNYTPLPEYIEDLPNAN